MYIIVRGYCIKIRGLMMKKSAALLAILATAAVSAPSFADGILGTTKSVAGSGTAMLVDVPEGLVVDSLVKCPCKASKSLAAAFGDENGWKQRIVGAVFGIPSGAVFGVPYGAIKGGKHAASVGWDKPFSSESFIVTNESK
jgi:hypothetical protein